MSKKQKTQKKFKIKNEGITIIALIITIIILLILAGVTILSLSGEDGLLKQATEAKRETENAVKNEKTDLSKMEDLINETLNGVKVEQVTDTNPGVLEGTGTDIEPYVINSIEDLVFFAYDVTNGNNYDGKYITLELSLDFNSTKSYADAYRTDYGIYGYDGELKTLLTTGEGFKSIGTTTEDDKEKNFVGTFDGNNNFINNLYINVTSNETSEKRGLFSNNFGTINNLKLINVNLYLKSNNGALAGISGQNSKTGNINNCLVSGIIKNESKLGATGGITCWCSGNISNCANLSNISSQIADDSDAAAAGICSSSGVDASITDCFNIGKIGGISDKGRLAIGGICGVCSGKIENCYNKGTIIGKAGTIIDIGGISGRLHGAIKNSYAICKIQSEYEESENTGVLVGFINGGSMSNSFYLKQDEINGCGNKWNATVDTDEKMKKEDSEMKQIEFVNLLNTDEAEIWKEDINNINGRISSFVLAIIKIYKV